MYTETRYYVEEENGKALYLGSYCNNPAPKTDEFVTILNNILANRCRECPIPPINNSGYKLKKIDIPDIMHADEIAIHGLPSEFKTRENIIVIWIFKECEHPKFRSTYVGKIHESPDIYQWDLFTGAYFVPWATSVTYYVNLFREKQREIKEGELLKFEMNEAEYGQPNSIIGYTKSNEEFVDDTPSDCYLLWAGNSYINFGFFIKKDKYNSSDQIKIEDLISL